MNRSESILKLAPALLKVQREMGDAKKGASNPYFKSTYADLNSIREAALPVLNENGIVCLQPTIEVNMKNFVETVLVHESGEWVSSLTEIKNTDGKAQSEGSGISYARRYGLQSLLNIGAVDDDAEGTMSRKDSQIALKTTAVAPNSPVAKGKPGRPPKAVVAANAPALASSGTLTPKLEERNQIVAKETVVTKLPTKVANGFSGNGTHSNTVISNEDEW